MTELEYFTLDVFTRRPYGGNPLAVFPDASGLSAEEMQRIANELHLSETVFVRNAIHPDALRQLRIFTPEIELPFAGHPTIGAAHVLVHTGVVSSDAHGAARFILQENAGLVQIDVSDGTYPSTWLTAPQVPKRGPEPPPTKALASVLGIDAREIQDDERDAPRAYSAGVPYLFVPLRNQAALRGIEIDAAGWKDVLGAFWAPHLYVFTHLAGAAKDVHGFDRNREAALEGHVAARMFAPAMGISEDPATGAAAAALAGYIWDRERRGGRWRIAQGTEMGRSSELFVEIAADHAGPTSVRVGGDAVIMGRGAMRRPDG